MNSIDLLVICSSAFLAVFVLLAILALLMRIIIIIFPENLRGADAALIAAVTSIAQAVYPETKVTKVEEIK